MKPQLKCLSVCLYATASKAWGAKVCGPDEDRKGSLGGRAANEANSRPASWYVTVTMVMLNIIIIISSSSRSCSVTLCMVQFCFLVVLDPMVDHTMDALSSFISVFCHSDWLFHVESCLRLDVVHPGCVWSSSPACTWHCSLHYLFLQSTPLFPHGVTVVC